MGITASMATQQGDTAAKWREHPVAQPDSVKGNPWGEPACVERCPAWGLGLALRRICLGGGGCALFQPGGSSLSLGTLTGAEPHWEFRAGPA